MIKLKRTYDEVSFYELETAKNYALNKIKKQKIKTEDITNFIKQVNDAKDFRELPPILNNYRYLDFDSLSYGNEYYCEEVDTIGEIKDMYKGQYAAIEVYAPNDTGEHMPSFFHTDNCHSPEEWEQEYDDYSDVVFYELMNEEEYNYSILANGDATADFTDWYGDKNAKVLCIMLEDN